MDSTKSFENLFQIAVATVNERQISSNSWAGSVAAAILTDKGNVYTGVCIDTPCSMGFCAEHAAIAAMVTAGETRIVKLTAVMGRTGKAIPPCGRCREFICQIDDENDKCEVLLDEGRIVTIGELLPDRWS
jgi:cytidine deaminase